MNTFFISDTHFYHKNIIQYAERPYKHVDHMNDDLIKKWNNTVGKRDKVFFLGDFAFANAGKARSILFALNGDITFIMGNHDRKGFFEGCHYSEYPIIFDKYFILSHDPVFLNDKMPYVNIHNPSQ